MTEIARRIVAISALLLATGSTVQAAPVSDLSLGQTGVIQFESLTPTSISEFVRKQTTAKVTINGTLTLPDGAGGKVPAMIIAHHCNGITSSVTNLAAFLNNLGIATFVPESFESRGIIGGVCSGSTLNNTAAVADNLFALKLLATHPNIDASRIGIVGQSYGGTAVYTTAFEEARKAVIDGPLKFAAHIGMYPSGCSTRYWSDNVTGAPILSLLGELDDWTPPGPCMDFAEKLRARGAPTTTIVYPGALHAWVNPPNSYSQNDKWSSVGNCYWQYRMDTLISMNYKTGERFTSSEAVQNYLNSCRVYGASQGGNAAIKAKSDVDIADFLARVFKLTNVATSASQPDRIFNYLEDIYKTYLMPAGATSQTASGYYFRHYPTTNLYIATNGDGQVYYYLPGSTPKPTPLGSEASLLNEAGLKGY
ncbi:MAG: dienelactone hydrolase family protein [Betaproteobacteria bacterium]|nr:dienelactone hydrolase family protein [Betaproteobacteria bacterium]